MFIILHYLERVGKNGSDQGLDRLNVAVCARFIYFLKSSYCSHDHNFTLQSLKLKQRAALRKIYIYQAQLQWRTPKNTKHVCLLMFSRCVIDYKHLLIQLWINRVTAEGALLSTLNRFCCRFST